MKTFIGDYSCRVDSKGRIMLPAAFKRQMTGPGEDRFVVKGDIFEKCLILFPVDEWERQNKIIRKNTNPFNREHGRFLRNFYRGTAEIQLDSNNRMLIPKRLLDYASIGNEVILAGQTGRIEIWASGLYRETSETGEEFAAMAEKILGNSLSETDDEA